MIPSVSAVAIVLALQLPPPGPVPSATSLDPTLGQPTVTDAPLTIRVPVIVRGTRSAATTIRATSPDWKEPIVVDVPPLDRGEHPWPVPLPATLEPGTYIVTLEINRPRTQQESEDENNSVKVIVKITRSTLWTRIAWLARIPRPAIIGIALVLAVGSLIARISRRAPRAAAAMPNIVFKAFPVPGTQAFRGSKGAWGEFDVSLRPRSGPSSSSVIEEKEGP
jgi:hypothetical protein